MKRILLSLVALVFLTLVSPAWAVTCYWVGGGATWDNTNTGGGGTGGIKWASASGGGTACSGGGTGGSPGSSDAAVFDGSSGGGTVTVASTINGSNIIISIDMGAFASGTLDFSVNNPTINFSGVLQKFSVTGTATRTLKTGTATFNFANNGFGTWDFTTVTGLTCICGSETTNVAARTAAAPLVANSSVTLGTVNLNLTASGNVLPISGGINVTTLNVNSGTVAFADSNSTIGTLAVNGSSSAPVLVTVSGNTPMSNTLTVTTLSGSWGVFRGLKFNSSKSITSSYDMGGNTNLTITTPAIGGGGIIGG